MLLMFLLWRGPVVAGGLSTPGQGARALGMAGAFTAVADDGSAVYYNPAGIDQVEGTTIQGSLALLAPRLRYTTPGDATEHSTKKALAPSFFITHRLTDRFNTGIGLYAPYARDAKYSDDLANGFASLRSKLLRTDFSAVVSYQATSNLAIGGGVVIGYSELDRSAPAGPGLRINDKVEGVGFGGIVGVLWQVNDQARLGVTYRSEMLVDHGGKRTIIAGGLPTTSNARAKLRYPASIGVGIAYMPTPRLTLALDADWYGWDSLDQVTTRTDLSADSVTVLNARDSRDFKFGAEYRLPSGWRVRGGYAYSESAFPGNYITPAQPDANGHEIGLGIGRETGHWRFDLAWHYAVTHEKNVTANTFGFNGKYNIDQHLLGFTAAYRY